MNAKFTRHELIFKQASGTSRGVLTSKETYLLEISKNGQKGIGECAIFRGLSFDDRPDYEEKLKWLCENINQDFEFLKEELKVIVPKESTIPAFPVLTSVSIP